jgi:hypothetical protein
MITIIATRSRAVVGLRRFRGRLRLLMGDLPVLPKSGRSCNIPGILAASIEMGRASGRQGNVIIHSLTPPDVDM